MLSISQVAPLPIDDMPRALAELFWPFQALCDQYEDDIVAIANDANHLHKNLRATFEYIRKAGLKLTMHKCRLGATEIDFLGRTITTGRSETTERKGNNLFVKNDISKIQKDLQKNLVFLNYYRNYIPRLSEKHASFFQLHKRDEKVLVTTELVHQFIEINRELNKCSQLALKQTLPNKQLVLMTDAIFTAAGYAILTEDDPDQKYTSVKKSFAPFAYGSKNFHAITIQNVNIRQRMLSYQLRIQRIWTHFLGNA